MGRERQQSNDSKPIKITTGVEVRHWKGSSSIRIRFTYKGVECRETLKLEPTANNIKFAERLRGEILNAIEKGTFSYINYFPDSKRARIFGHFKSVDTNITVGEMLTDFLEQTKKINHLSTYRTYKKRCDAHLMAAFGDIPVKELAPLALRKWVLSLTLAPKTIRNILIPLRAVLEEAVNNDIIEKSPLDRVKLTKLLNKPNKQITTNREYKVDPFDINEIKAILANVENQARNLFKFAFFTGLRPSELIALEWGDIDWVNGLIHVTRAVVEREEKCTKTEAGERHVLLLPPAIEALQAQKLHTLVAAKRVFHNPKTKAPWVDDAQIRRSCWRYALTKAKVRYRNPYQTRHTYASMMLSSGENMLWIASQMGHCDTEMIIKTYAKWIPDTSTKAGYRTLNNWSNVLQLNCLPNVSQQSTHIAKNIVNDCCPSLHTATAF